MRRFRLALLAATLCCAANAAAQDGSPEVRADAELAVTYTILGRLGTAGDPLAVPTDLVERLASEPHLARLEIGPQGGSRLSATFVFPNHDQFRAWNASPAARDLLRLLATRLLDPTYRLDVLRPSMARYLRTTSGGE